MNTFKRISAIVLALVMVLSLGLTVFAANPDDGHTTSGLDGVKNQTEYTITIVNNDDDGTHKYNAYQIFSGNLENGKLTDIDWGSSIVTSKTAAYPKAVNPNAGEEALTLLAALKKLGGAFATLEPATEGAAYPTAEAVAEALSKTTGHDEVLAQNFAKVIANYLDLNAPANTAPVEVKGKNAQGEIKVKGPGYYLVMDTENPDTEAGTASKSRFILEVVDNVTVKSKADAPSVDKVIVEDGQEVDHNTASIGDKINYKLKSNVPDMTGYNEYYFVYWDTMSAGLTFNNDVSIKIGNGEPLTADKFYVEYYTEDASQQTTEPKGWTKVEDHAAYKADTNGKKTLVKIVIKDFIDYKAQKGAAIEVTYSATLNEYAKITTEGNPNDVKLDFSNDPNYDYDGDKDEFGPDDPKGETPKDEVITYTTALDIYKWYMNENVKTKLEGAEFKLTGTKLNKTIVKGTRFVEDNESGTYYKLTDGTYTTTAPGTDGISDDKYVDKSGNTKYKKVEYTEEKLVAEKTEAQAFVGSDGHLTFKGLAPGVYVIEEVTAPAGFNKLKNAMAVEIKAEWDATKNEYKWFYRTKSVPNGTEPESVTFTDEEWTQYFGETADTPLTSEYFTLDIENKQGLELPSTGGMGTTIFYIVGGIMLLAAMAVCVSKVLSPKVKSTKVVADI